MYGRGLLRLVRAAGVTALVSPSRRRAANHAADATFAWQRHNTRHDHDPRHDDDHTPGAAAPSTAPNAAAPPTPAPPSANQLPPVDVIQKKAQPAPKAAAKKAPPKKQVAAPAPAPPAAEPPPQLDTPATYQPGEGGIDSGTVQMSPVEGSSIPIGKFPGAVGRGSAEDFNRTGYTYAPEVLQQTVPGVILGDAQGNVFQRNLQFRGFESSPVNGVPQGLAVYQNGVRINESFGDIVNYDFLPDNAISGMTIIGANPVFGLNALGGALTIMMRDGFNFQGAELNVMGGSFGRYQGGLAVGGNSGSWGGFMALEGIHDNGYRDFSASRIRRMYADVGAKGDGTEFHLNFTGAANYVGVTAAAPVQLLDLNWANTFTSPQTTKNQVAMISANGNIEVSPTWSLQGVGYYRWFKQSHIDGNISEAEECDGDRRRSSASRATTMISSVGVGPGVNPDGSIPSDIADPLGSLDQTSQLANSFGFAGQAVNKDYIAGYKNQFLIGASYDRGNVGYGATSTLGSFDPKFVVNSLGILLVAPSEVSPRDLTTLNDYYGVYFSDTVDLTSDLALTVGGRYNFARVQIHGRHRHRTAAQRRQHLPALQPDGRRHVPAESRARRSMPAMRRPTARRRRPSSPARIRTSHVLLESFLTADPPLDQVVSHTWELGLRGRMQGVSNERFEWSAGLFRALNSDDIYQIADEISGRGYFDNVGDTLRQGVEIGGRYTDDRWMVYANYAFVHATFQSSFILPSPEQSLWRSSARTAPALRRPTMSPTVFRSTRATASRAFRSAASRRASTI